MFDAVFNKRPYFISDILGGSNEEAVQITTDETDNTVTLKLKVAEEDMGRVIGKGGKTAKAIRALVKAASDPRGKRVVVEIFE